MVYAIFTKRKISAGTFGTLCYGLDYSRDHYPDQGRAIIAMIKKGGGAPKSESKNRGPNETDLQEIVNRGSVRVPGVPMRWMPMMSVTPTEETPESAPTPSAPPSPPSSPHGSWRINKDGSCEPVKDPLRGRRAWPTHVVRVTTAGQTIVRTNDETP